MSERPYYRSPLLAWAQAALTGGLGFLWLLPRFAYDLNKVTDREAIDASFYTTVLTAFAGLHLLNLLILVAFGVDLGSADAAGIRAWFIVIAVGAEIALIASLIAVNTRISQELGEPSGIGDAAFIVALTLLLVASAPYLQNRLNILGRGRTTSMVGAETC